MQFFKIKYIGVVGFAAILASCGSSDDSGVNGVTGVTVEAPTSAVEPTLTIASVKTVNVTWADVADATFYQLFENPDGLSGFTQVGSDIDAGVEGVDHIVPLYERTNASYLVAACNEGGCVNSSTVTVGDTLNDGIGYIKASNTGAIDEFGNAVSISDDGTVLAIGAIKEGSNATGVNGDEANNDADRSGAVYVFQRNGRVWQQQAYIKASNTDLGDIFGVALSLSGDGTTLAVGAISESSNATGVNGSEANNDADDSGAVYVYAFDGTSWSQQAYIKASNAEANDAFGSAVSISDDGTVLAIGATEEDSNATGVNGDEANNDAVTSGAVYVFQRNGRVWQQQAYIKASNAEAGDEFGKSVSLSDDGTVLAIGAVEEDSNATGVNGNEANNDADASGAVYVFKFDGASWSQQAYIKASNTNDNDSFGMAVSLSGDGTTLAVGADVEESNATGVNGNEANNDADASGAVYVFKFDGASWNQQAYIKASNTDVGDAFGTAVSLSDDGIKLAVSSPDEDGNAIGINGDEVNNDAENSGATYVFEFDGTAWAQTAYLKASNTDPEDTANGIARLLDLEVVHISLSGDGETLAVGAYNEESSATGVNGDASDNSLEDAGAVYLY